jgi:hypothetical protein
MFPWIAPRNALYVPGLKWVAVPFGNLGRVAALVDTVLRIDSEKLEQGAMGRFSTLANEPL